jgi:hypothetical protein
MPLLLHRHRHLRQELSVDLIPDLANLVLGYATEPWRKPFGRGCRAWFETKSTFEAKIHLWDHTKIAFASDVSQIARVEQNVARDASSSARMAGQIAPVLSITF